MRWLCISYLFFYQLYPSSPGIACASISGGGVAIIFWKTTKNLSKKGHQRYNPSLAIPHNKINIQNFRVGRGTIPHRSGINHLAEVVIGHTHIAVANFLIFPVTHYLYVQRIWIVLYSCECMLLYTFVTPINFNTVSVNNKNCFFPYWRMSYNHMSHKCSQPCAVVTI